MCSLQLHQEGLLFSQPLLPKSLILMCLTSHAQVAWETTPFKNEETRLAWNNCQQVVPTTAYTSAVPLYELLQRNAQLLLYCAGLVDMPADAEQLCACRVRLYLRP